MRLTQKLQQLPLRCISLLLVVACSYALGDIYAQDENARRKGQDENANRSRNVNTNPNRNRHRPIVRPPVPKVRMANLVLAISPPDSSVWLNNEKRDLDSSGGLSLKDLAPNSYTLIVRHAGYRDDQRTLDLKAGDNPAVTITLELLKGSLSVRPSVDGTSIEVRSIDRNQSVGSYGGAIDEVDLPPGEYELTVSKPGYQVTTRTITIKPGGLVNLEPRLDPLPTPTPTPRTVIAARSTVDVEGKYLVVRVLGTSGDTSRTTGTVNVTLNRATPTASVQGSLNGLQCQVSFVSLENVAEWSLIESPSPSNNWALIVVRVRPKDSKRPISFAVNWVGIKNSSASLSESTGPAEVSSPAVITYMAQPEYPQMARSSRTGGVVTVSVLIDEQGKVKSAKAIDGPLMLRQSAENAARQCRFRPATRNGTATQSTETIAFVFRLN